MKIFYMLIFRCLYGNRNTPVIGNNICCCCLVAKLYLTLVILWNVAHQTPLSMGFSRQEYWSGLPFPLPGDLPDLGMEPGSPALQADSLPSEPPEKPHLRFN